MEILILVCTLVTMSDKIKKSLSATIHNEVIDMQ
jgi:hypothetical protein